jgi:hypothetical protein
MRAVAFLFVLAILVPAPRAFADKPAPPTTYKKLSTNAQYVFVMISPEPLEKEVKGWIKTKADEILAIRSTYTNSGLYKNDGSNKPLWTVNWYSFNVVVPADGVHLVSFGPWPTAGKSGFDNPVTKSDLRQTALLFFANGKELRHYYIEELVDRPNLLPRSVSHYMWHKSSSVLGAQQEFELFTHDGNRILFDLKTGKILKKERVDQK